MCVWVSKLCLQSNSHSCLPSAGVLRIGSSGVKSNMASLASVIAARYCLLVTSHIITMTMSKGCCLYAQATQWGQIAGFAAHSVVPSHLLPFHLQLVGPATHTLRHIGTTHGLLRWTITSYPPSVACHVLMSTVAALFCDSNVAEVVHSCIIRSHKTSTNDRRALLFSPCSVRELSTGAKKVLTPNPESKPLISDWFCGHKA